LVNLVAAYGCSFTEGQELPDEQFIKAAEKKKRKMGWRAFSKKYRNIIHSEEYLKSAKNMAWPKHVADMLDVEYYNNAQGGTSLEDACAKLTLDINRKIVDSDSLILIGLTNVARWVQPLKNFDRHFLSDILVSNDEYSRAYTIVNSDAKLLHYYYSNLEYLELMAIKNNLNIKCYCMWQDVPTYILNIKNDVTLNYYEYMIARWDNLKASPIFNWDTKLSTFAKFPGCNLGGGHFSEKVHKDFAKFVYNDIKDSII